MIYASRIAAQTVHYGMRVDFYLRGRGGGQKETRGTLNFVERTDGELEEPAFSVDLDAAQEMFEQLWSQGFRSKHDRGNSDKLDAARIDHIADLRKAAKLDREPTAR
jgi:hypothetical protein